MAAMALLGHEPKEPDIETQRYWERGKQIGRYKVEQLQAKYGEDSVIAEKLIPWPAGIGHADAFVEPEALTVEVKSRVELDPTDDDWLQLWGYMHYDEESRRGALTLVNPISLEERVLPTILTAEARELVEERAEEIVRAGKSGELPPCVCEKPSECWAKQCPFTAVAWADWEAPALDPVADPKLGDLIRDLYRCETSYKSAKAVEGERKAEREELRQALSDYELHSGRDYLIDGFRLRRTEVKPRVTYAVAEALKAGVLFLNPDATPEDLEAYVKVGKPSLRWIIEPTEEAGEAVQVGAQDFGDDPPF